MFTGGHAELKTTVTPSSRRELLSSEDIGRAVKRISHQIVERRYDLSQLILLGIRTRGEFIAGRIRDNILTQTGDQPQLDSIDITPFRDDQPENGLAQIGIKDLKVAVENRVVILIDDVIYTGRTVRAALDAILQQGRAAKVELGVLVDRGHREIPIKPDYVGKNIPTKHNETVSVNVAEVDGFDSVLIQTI